MSITRTSLLAVLCALAGAAPAGAVVGGEPVAPESVPWLADVGGCGGTLVAPDRVLTAGHCVMNAPLSNIAGVLVGTEQRHGTRFAMHPGWRQGNGQHNVLDDVAIVQLDAPVTTVAPVTLGATRNKVTKADAGHPLVCSVTASNGGGISTAPFAPSSMVKIPR